MVDPRRAKVTLEEYAKGWLAGRHDPADRTVELYSWLLDTHVTPALGTVALGQLSPSRVRSWNAALAKSHPVVAAKAYRLLSSMMRAAVADEVIVRNPCQVKSAGTERGPERPLATVAEVAALANAMPANLRLAVLVAAWCQLRRAELLGLRRRDVDLLHRTLTVEVTKTTMMSGKAVVKAPKTDAGRRTIAIPSHVIPELETHLTEHVAGGADAWLFPVTSRTLDGAWRSARSAIKRLDLHLHDLRHSGLT